VHALLEALDSHLPHLVPRTSDHAARVGVGLRQHSAPAAPGTQQLPHLTGKFKVVCYVICNVGIC